MPTPKNPVPSPTPSANPSQQTPTAAAKVVAAALVSEAASAHAELVTRAARAADLISDLCSDRDFQAAALFAANTKIAILQAQIATARF